MSGLSQSVRPLLRGLHEGYVFGPGVAFQPFSDTHIDSVETQIMQQVPVLAGQLSEHLTKALPDHDDAGVRTIVSQILPKTASFVPALTDGELTDTTQATSAGIAVGAMYASDQLVDRGDEAMLLAIEKAYGDKPDVPTQLATLVRARGGILKLMRTAVSQAAGNDAKAVFDCFSQKVLRTEAWLQRRSNEYRAGSEDFRRTFLDKYAGALAIAMSTDAGVQSVSASLYPSYRRLNPDLPSVASIHRDPAIIDLLKVYNTTARVADERGDWSMDAGNRPEFGIFSINPFNEFHPGIVGTLCDLAMITDVAQRGEITVAFRDFHRNGGRDRIALGGFVTDQFFDCLRQATASLPETVAIRYEPYVRLTKRVGEVSYVNMVGDMNLAA